MYGYCNTISLTHLEIDKNLPENRRQKNCLGKHSLEQLFQILVYKIWVEMRMLDEDM